MSIAVEDRSSAPVYGERVLAIEPYSGERIPPAEQHGKPFHLFPLWFGANLTIADFALGFVLVGVGLPLGATILALAVGNLLGGALLGLASAMGPRTGYPQMIAGRWAFGRLGEYLPATLNWISTAGWFAINNILGSFGLQVLFPQLPFAAAAMILVVIQVLLAVFGHNVIHLYERTMSVLLGILFVGVTVVAAGKFAGAALPHPAAGPHLPLFAIVLAGAFSYIASWSPYASDYSRYLAPRTPIGAAFGWTFLGSALASFWLEMVGVLVAVVAGTGHNPIESLHSVTGGLGAIAVLAIILGATAADALNLYSNSLSARALDLKVSRIWLTIVAGLVGLGLSLYGSGNFSGSYENFLLLLDYWITPWLAVLLVDFFILRGGHTGEGVIPKGIRWRAMLSYLLGVAVSVPFMSTSWFTGPIAARWDGADFSYYIGFLVAGSTYLVWQKFLSPEAAPGES